MMPPLVDTLIEDPRWEALELGDLAERAARETLLFMEMPPEGYEISLLGCDDARIGALNAEFRGREAPTNVLSWPSEERGAPEDGAPPAPVAPVPAELGDIAIAYDTCMREADAQGIPPRAHVTHLLVHGVLHLLGYDHMRDGDAALMESREVGILARLGVADPYETAGA